MFGFPIDPFTGLPGRNANNALIPHHPSLFGHSMMPFPGMNDFFAPGGSPFAMMDRMMRDAQQGAMQSFSSTTVMSYNATDGQPKIYQQSTSRRRGPGGIEETRQAVRDSERGINKVQIGHRIGDRKHVIEREMNAQTGQISENVELENLDEEETDEFQREWRQRSAQMVSHLHPRSHQHRQSAPPLAIEHSSTPDTSHRHHPKLSQRVHSDAIDLTDRQNHLPSANLKRKSSSSQNSHGDRRHRHNRF